MRGVVLDGTTQQPHRVGIPCSSPNPLTDVEPNEWQQTSFLEQLVSASVKVTIAEGQKARQDLRIAR